jgi:hypothetical protein
VPKTPTPNPTDEVVWCNRGWQPVYFGFCPSKRAWTREMKKMGCPQEPYPTSDGRATTFTMRNKVSVIVSLDATVAKERSPLEITGLLAHEATHIWQKVRETMEEQNPSIEFEAYSVQAIYQELFRAWLDTSAPAAVRDICLNAAGG